MSEIQSKILQTSKKNRGRLGDTWYLDEVFINIIGVLQEPAGSGSEVSPRIIHISQ
ncbi:hypothetical protein [uncultured Paraglaciecola sp.]|uniref:hypothetical protein n=1 Tax=uncultured Paraglaciecola sp. TaxID=1765024 RepID=UPI0025D65EF3|nr:hypothetical protein [uncultured Paraglaciecola sp.]